MTICMVHDYGPASEMMRGFFRPNDLIIMPRKCNSGKGRSAMTRAEALTQYFSKVSYHHLDTVCPETDFLDMVDNPEHIDDTDPEDLERIMMDLE